MVDDYFGKEEEDTDEDEVEEEDKEEEIEIEYDSIKDIIKEANKVAQELEIRIPDIEKRIGRVNADLFGDPEQEDFYSKLEELQDEIERPMTARHPIAQKIKNMIPLIKEMQIEYKNAQRFLKSYLKKRADLLKGAVLVYKDDMVKMEKKIEKFEEKKPKTEKMTHTITQEMVDEFMQQKGFPSIERYNQAAKERNLAMAGRIKGGFATVAASYFRNFTNNPKLFADKLFNEYVDIPYEKLKASIRELPAKKILESVRAELPAEKILESVRAEEQQEQKDSEPSGYKGHEHVKKGEKVTQKGQEKENSATNVSNGEDDD